MGTHPTTVGSLFAKCVTTGGPDACWPWAGRCPDRYGTVSLNNRPTPAHRAAYMLCVGEIPPGMFVCHKCDNPRCCNPKHLFLGSHQNNMDDCRSKGRHSHGERHPDAILTEDDVRAIIAARGGVRGTGRRLAREYGIAPVTVSAIWAGRIWKHIPRSAA
jgi:hypothetical protein